jgi:hypothetical protein
MRLDLGDEPIDLGVEEYPSAHKTDCSGFETVPRVRRGRASIRVRSGPLYVLGQGRRAPVVRPFVGQLWPWRDRGHWSAVTIDAQSTPDPSFSEYRAGTVVPRGISKDGKLLRTPCGETRSDQPPWSRSSSWIRLRTQLWFV